MYIIRIKQNKIIIKKIEFRMAVKCQKQTYVFKYSII